MKISRRLWPRPQLPAWSGGLFPLLLFVTLVWSLPSLAQTSILWQEGFELPQEDYWSRWHVEGGVWAIGAPTVGPAKAFAGTQCAATGLDSDYPPSSDARLIRDQVFTVPPASDFPRLRFWNWFEGGPDATPTVEIKVGTGPWQPISSASGWFTNSWTRTEFDLSPFSAQPIQIALHFQSGSSTNVGAGWFVDDVMVETGLDTSNILNTPEGFESGLGSWTVDHGVWNVGAPSPSVVRPFAGLSCAGTVLTNNYLPGADSRLISPEFVVPGATNSPRLRFWHWFSIWPGDFGQVEISVAGAGWQPLSERFTNNGSVWTRPAFDLSPFADQSVQIAFHFQSNPDTNVALGWYIDDVVVETGPQDWDPVNAPETFEAGQGNWTVDAGTWEVGGPTFGARNAVSGSHCAGTVLAGNYGPNVDSRLISPPFTVPAAADLPRLRFWQWLRNQPGDPGTVEIRLVGGDWQALSGPLVGQDGTWARAFFALDQYAGKRVQVAFHFQSNGDSNTDAGWYVDDVTVETGPLKLAFLRGTESFENGLGDWSVDYGSWQVGTPAGFPDAAHTGTNCAGTGLNGNYPNLADSRLISPAFVVPLDNPRLRFWHWFSMWPGDFGAVEVSVTNGVWQAISPQFSSNGVVWSEPWVDLGPFAGQNVRLAFHFHSNGDGNVGAGWYIDDVTVATGPSDWPDMNTAEGFEAGLDNWSVDNGTWEVGHPYSGPGQAFAGTNCAGTVIRFGGSKYIPNTDSRLVSPALTVPCADAQPRLRFAQWYDIAAGDAGTVEIRVAGGPWQSVLGPISGASRQWTAGFYDLTPYAGQRVQLAFHLQANDDDQVGAGWYIDEVRIQATVLQPVDSAALTHAEVGEGSLFTAVFGSTCQNPRFILGSQAPAGASLDPTLGILAWFPSPDQGAGVYPMQVCVADANQPLNPLQCMTFNVTVVEVNHPPVVDPIPAQVITAGVPVQLTVTATDPDLPQQKLTFSLDQGAPFGATIDPDTGVFSWTPTPTQATIQSTITVRVTDNGDPPLSATASFTAAPSNPVTPVTLKVMFTGPGQITICVSSPQGFYTLESTSSLDPSSSSAEWIKLQTIWRVRDEPDCVTTTATSTPIRFYRIRSGQ